MNYNFNIEVPSYINLSGSGISDKGIYRVELPVTSGMLYSINIRSLPGINGKISISIEDKHGNKILPMGNIYSKTYNGYTFNKSGGKFILYGNDIDIKYPCISYVINDISIFANFIVTYGDEYSHLVMINISIIPDSDMCNIK